MVIDGSSFGGGRMIDAELSFLPVYACVPLLRNVQLRLWPPHVS
jgi:hypothetical protein